MKKRLNDHWSMFSPISEKDRTIDTPPVEGMIAAHHLQQWWFETFTEDERERITTRFQPDDAEGDRPLTQGSLAHSSGSAAGLLNSLAGYFNNPGERDIARRIATKAMQLAKDADDIPNLHFAYLELIKINMRDRYRDPEALAAAIDACERQIELAPGMARIFGYPANPLPPHLGYITLASIYEEQGCLDEALRLVTEAKEQGWLGQWDERIERLRVAIASQDGL